MSLENSVEAGNIVRERWPEHDFPLYLGSGRAGAKFDAFGLMNGQNTALRHADAWSRDAAGVDHWHAVGQLKWAGPAPAEPESYRQCLTLLDGRLATSLHWPELQLELVAWFDPGRPDLLAVQIDCRGRMPALKFQASAEVTGVEVGGDECALELGETIAGLRTLSEVGEVVVTSDSSGVTFSFSSNPGRHLLLIGVARQSRGRALRAELRAVENREAYARASAAHWRQRWGHGWVDLPDRRFQALWARSLFYVLASYAPDVRSMAPPMGWSGSGWSVHFPQDLSYIHPALLRHGHVDIAKAWSEFYASHLEAVRDYTSRIWGVEGCMWPWNFPIGPNPPLLPTGGDWNQLADRSNDWYQYELHNAAYPARMAAETAAHLKNPLWTREIAWPIVYASAQFYGALLQRQSTGRWGIEVRPSTGQDEFGAHNARNYLDALFSAKYCLQAALGMANELSLQVHELARWRIILAQGLAFDALLDSASGLLATRQTDAWKLGLQKHPVQLNGITSLPIERSPRPEECAAFVQRHALCVGANQGYYYGWTLAAFLVAAVHLDQPEALAADLETLVRVGNVDPDGIQFFESAAPFAHEYSFFVTSHGLFLQAISDAAVNDYWGETRFGTFPKSWAGARFGGLRTADGLVHEGRFDGTHCVVHSSPLRTDPII